MREWNEPPSPQLGELYQMAQGTNGGDGVGDESGVSAAPGFADWRHRRVSPALDGRLWEIAFGRQRELERRDPPPPPPEVPITKLSREAIEQNVKEGLRNLREIIETYRDSVRLRGAGR
jgi:hypothetical protein